MPHYAEKSEREYHYLALALNAVAIFGASLWFHTLPYCHSHFCIEPNGDLWQMAITATHNMGAVLFWFVITPAVMFGLIALFDLKAWIKGDYVRIQTRRDGA